MKNIMLLVLILFSYSRIHAQGVIELTCCNEMNTMKLNNFIVFSIVNGNDTLSFPSISKNKYLNPLNIGNQAGQYTNGGA